MFYPSSVLSVQCYSVLSQCLSYAFHLCSEPLHLLCFPWVHSPLFLRSSLPCLPAGGLASVHLHMARSICRRAERSVVALSFTPLDASDLPAPAVESISKAGEDSSSSNSQGTASSEPNSSTSSATAGVPVAAASPVAGSGVPAAVAAGVPGPAEEMVEPAVRYFLNRLSDFLFVAARYAAHKVGRAEETYQKASQ